MVASSNLSNSAMDDGLIETLSPSSQEMLETVPTALEITPANSNSSLKLSKQAIRSSLKASTFDSIFSAIFGSITSGVLLSNFLLELGATSVEIGMLASFPMLVNLLQPLGAYLADRTTSRLRYGLWIFGPSRLLWLILAIGIWFASTQPAAPHQLVSLTLVMVLLTNVMGALGSPSWLSWMAALVPRRLRGRYFGFRNSAASLTTLLCVPLLGVVVSAWPRGSIQGYGALLLLGVVVGLISLGCQIFMADVNPQEQATAGEPERERVGEWDNDPVISPSSSDALPGSNFSLLPFASRLSQEANFLRFLLYFGLWTFAVNTSGPFFNLYMLDNLDINVSWVTLYTSLASGANLLMLVMWGKLADRIGNRPLLMLVGILVAVTPLLWLGTGSDSLSVWLWFPLLHVLSGGTWAAIDLCSNNIQMSVAPTRNQATYFAIAAAVAGVCGALGTTAGGFLAQFAEYGGLPGLFALSSVLRLAALLPLVFVQEHRSQPLSQLIQLLQQRMEILWDLRPQLVPVRTVKLLNRSK